MPSLMGFNLLVLNSAIERSAASRHPIYGQQEIGALLLTQNLPQFCGLSILQRLSPNALIIRRQNRKAHF